MRALPSSAARTIRSYSLPLLSAAAANLSFYPFRQEGLVWIALTPMLVWLGDPRVSKSQAFNGLVLVGTAYHFAIVTPFLSLGWWGWGMTTIGELRHYFSYQRIFLAVLLAGVAVWGGLVLALVGRLMRRHVTNPLASLWVIPSAWVLILEYMGHRTVFGFGWGLLGNRLHGSEVLRQTASVTGVYGLSFFILMVNALLASWVIAWRRRTPRSGLQWMSGSLLQATAILFLVIIGMVGYGRAALHSSRQQTAPVRVALLQGARAEYAEEDFTSDGLDRLYTPMIEQAVTAGTDLLVLPETVWLRTLQLDDTTAPGARHLVPLSRMQSLLSQKLRGTRTLLALGIDAVSGGRIYNTTTFWTTERLIGVYRKRRLVPFSEYRPALLGWLAPQNRIHGAQFAFTPGHGPQLIRTPQLTLGPFICQEVMFPDLVRQSVRAGAQLLVTTGNDGVFMSPMIAFEQANLAQLRAVENGRSLLRCMKTGVSAVIDPQGRVLTSAPINAKAVISGQAYPSDRLTWYTRYGDWIVAVAALIVLAALFSGSSQLYKHGQPSV